MFAILFLRISQNDEPMRDYRTEFREWLVDNLRRKGRGSRTALAEKLGVRTDAISRMTSSDPSKETRRIDAAEMAKMVEFFGCAPPFDLDSMDVADSLDSPNTRAQNVAPLVGFVGAGSEVYPIDDHAKGDGLEEIEAPFPVSPHTVCVAVRGDSMMPVYEDGDLVGYSRAPGDPAELLNRRCLAKLKDGRLFIKVLKRGSAPGLFTLSSFNAPDIEDVALEWAAAFDFTLAGGSWRRIER